MGRVTKTAPPLPYEPPQLRYTYLGKYVLTEDFVVMVGGRQFIVPVGAVTDLASTPRFLWILLPPTDIYEAAAVAHDWWCSDGISRGELTSREADAFFRDMVGEAGVGRVKRWCMWAGVRIAAPFSSKRRPSGFIKDAPAVLGIGALTGTVTVVAVYGVDRLFHLFF